MKPSFVAIRTLGALSLRFQEALYRTALGGWEEVKLNQLKLEPGVTANSDT